MKTALKFTFSLLVLFGPGSWLIAAEEGEVIELFNGQSLSGWEGNSSLWSVEEGAITGTTTADNPLRYNQFLVWTGEPFDNFELTLDVRLVGNNNSGIQYRSRRLPDAGDFVIGGYQLDIHPNPPYNAMLYEERGRGILAQHGQQVTIDPDGEIRITGSTGDITETSLPDWNQYTVIARGNHLVHKLNGKTTIEITDHQQEARALTGTLALQVHVGPPMKVQFRNIRLRKLAEGELVNPQ